MVYGPVDSTFDPWVDSGSASFQDGDEVVEENCHIIMGWKLGMSEKEIEDHQPDMVDMWWDLTDSARCRYIDDYRRLHPKEVHKLYNEWYRNKHGRETNE